MGRKKKSAAAKDSRKKNLSQIDFLNIKRKYPTVQVPVGKIRPAEWMKGTDSIFLNLYKKYLVGRIPSFSTRIPIQQIKEGFYFPGEIPVYICDEPPEDVILDTVARIRSGYRPALHLYPHNNSVEVCRFMCPDDVVSCIAYKRLKIASVPAIVFAPGTEPLPNSAFEYKVSPKFKDAAPRLSGIVSAPMPQYLASSFKDGMPPDSILVPEVLSKSLENAIARLRLFHTPMPEQLHYHHTIFSAAVRMQETLRSIAILIEKDLWYQALALLRVLYEIHLNFYFDWLQPEQNYRFLAAASIWNTKGISQQRREMANELIGKGVLADDAIERSNLAWRGVSLASNIAEKAKLSKTGICYHDSIYDFLSQILHQDFEVASLHANRFEKGEFLTIDPAVKETSLQFMDIIVSETLTCFDDDIGDF